MKEYFVRKICVIVSRAMGKYFVRNCSKYCLRIYSILKIKCCAMPNHTSEISRSDIGHFYLLLLYALELSIVPLRQFFGQSASHRAIFKAQSSSSPHNFGHVNLI